MTFSEMIEAIKKGHKCARKGSVGRYLVLLPGQFYIWSVWTGSTSPTVNAALYTPDIDDLTKDDWMIIS